MTLYHGRTDPEQDMDDWGSVGPTLDDIVRVTSTYQATLRITFKDAEAALAARLITGWELDDDTLWVEVYNDMILAGGVFYGDYQLHS